ncbi:MAG: hypothetical protein B7X91_00370 [Hydrogenophilales bacterium 17-64-11]|nr:MAG: hypothetical protein B7X91_00370 [Hydrogenophilales bacterium 17-64-11]
MLRRPITLRVLSGLVVLAMGVLGMSLALVTGEIYHRLTLDNQRQGLSGMVGLAVGERIERLEEKSRSLGLSIQSDPTFERLLKAGDYSAVNHLLDDQFHQYFVTAGEVRLVQLRLFSPDFRLLAEAGEDVRGSSAQQAACPGVLEAAKRRRGAQRLQSLSALCAAPLPLHSLIVPVGGLFLRGYLEVVVDPSPNLIGLDKTLGMPLRLQSVTGSELYRSASWPATASDHGALAVDYALRGDGGREVLRLTMLSDVAALRGQLGETRRNILLVATLLTLAVAMLLYRVLRRTMLEPITDLLRRLQRYGQHGEADRKGMVPTRAIRELHALQDVYDTLDHLARTDPLTQLPNRAQFQDCLERHTTAEHRRNGGFALLIMDLDGFKQVNDQFGHHVGDTLLQQVAARLESTKRRGDVLARLGGDEFGMILPGVRERESAGSVADKLARILGDPFQIGSHACRVGVSIGIAFYPDDDADPDTLIRLADAAMYEAKRGRGGHAYANSGAA